MGEPKALLTHDGKTLVEHLAEQVRTDCDEVFIAGCPEPELYRGLSLRVIDDMMPDAGPLGGVLSALACLEQKNRENTAFFRYCLALPCDGIMLPDRFASRMMEALESGEHELVFARDAEREQPLYALLQTSLLADLQHYLQSGGRKVIDWYRTRDYAVVDFSADGFCFSNLNTPHDWQTFLRSKTDAPLAHTRIPESADRPHRDDSVRRTGSNGASSEGD